MQEKITGFEAAAPSLERGEYRRDQGMDAIEVAPYHREIIVSNFLFLRLGPLETRPGGPVERNEAIMRLRRGEYGPWIPSSGSKSELSISRSASEALTAAARTKEGDPRKAVESTYEKVAGYLRQSREKIKALHKGLSIPDGHEPEINTEAIRKLLQNNDALREVYVEYFMSKESTDHYDWPVGNNKKQRKQFFDEAMVEAAEYAPSYLLEKTHAEILNSEKSREKFWNDEFNNLHRLPQVQALLANPRYTPPSIRPRGELKIVEATERADLPEAKVGEVAISSPNFPIPEAVQKELDSRISDKEQIRIDTMIEQGIPPHLARKRVLGPGSEMSVEESDRADSREIAKNVPPGWPKKIKAKKPRFSGIRGDIADGGEARSKTERWLRGDITE